MNVTVQQRDLLRALHRTQGVADRKGTMPILANVLLAAGDDHLRLSATDLYLGARTSTQASVRTPGSVAVPAKTLFDIVRALPDGEAKIEHSRNDQVVVTAGRARYKLPGLAAADFPPLPPQPDTWRTLDAHVLAELVALTSYSMSTDDTRPHLAGTLFETNGAVARMVTTDGHRLSKAEATLGERVTHAAPLKVLIPHRGVGELKKLVDETRADAKASKTPATLDLATREGTAFFRRADANADVVLSVKLVDQSFPPYAKVIPTALTKRVVCGRLALVEAVKRLRIVANDKSGGVTFELVSGLLRVRGSNVDVGEGVEELDVAYEGEELKIGFNAKYLLESLGALGCDEVALEMKGELDAGVIRPVGDFAGCAVDFVGVVMPMRI